MKSTLKSPLNYPIFEGILVPGTFLNKKRFAFKVKLHFIRLHRYGDSSPTTDE